MTVEEMLHRKQVMEQKILSAIRTFEELTKLEVRRVELEALGITYCGESRRQQITRVSVEVGL